MRRMIQGAALGVACSLLGMASLGGDTGFASSPRSFTEDSPVTNVADVINTIGTQMYSASFAGVRVDDGRDLTVFLAGQDLVFLGRVNATAGSQIHVNYVVVRHSLQQLIALEQDIAIRDRDVLIRDGVNVGSVFPDVPSNGLVATLLTPSSSLPGRSYVASARGILQSRYGSVLTVSNTTMLPSTSVTRYNDTPPFYGGDQIASGGAVCTSGISVYSSSLKKDGILAAGHCFPKGASVSISCYSPAPSCIYCCDAVGPVGQRFYPPAGSEYDAEVIWGSSVGWVWGGSPTSPVIYKVSGAVDPVDGTDMTIDGSSTGERTGQLVTEYSGCVSITYGSSGTYAVCGVGQATGSSPPCKPGDSGGPAYVHSGSSVEAAGIIIAAGGNSCVFTEILAAQGLLGVTVVNG